MEHVYSKDYYTISKPVKLILLATGLIAYFLVKIIRFFVKVRFAMFPLERIGEAACTGETYLRWRADKVFPEGEKHVFITGVPSNRQFLKMFARRAFVVVANKYFLWMVFKLQLIFPKSDIWFPDKVCSLKDITNFYPRFNSQPPQMSFTKEEEAKGQEFLAGLNLPPKADFVCVHARDKAYLANVHQYKDWIYHDYRDADIDTYIPAMKYLSSQGIYVFRMGYKVEKKLELDDPLVIDYANMCRSDFADLYLSAHCKFFIASEGGIQWIPWAFDVPVAYTNAIPPDVGGRKPVDICLPKKLWSKDKKRLLTFREGYALGADKWFRMEQYVQENVEIVNNSPEEILGVTVEINERLNGTWEAKPEDEDLQRRYLETLPDYFRCSGPALPRLSAVFLRMNKQLLD